MSDERRLFSRILFQASASLSVAGSAVAVDVLDLSLKGALVRPHHDFPVALGAACRLTLQLDSGDAVILMDARVAHLDDGLVGLACEEIDLDSITHLRRLVELNLGDEALLDRELAILIGA
jgi:hypothetical protein